MSNDMTTQGEFTTNAMTFDTAHSKSPTNYETIKEKLWVFSFWILTNLSNRQKEQNDLLDYPLRKRDSSDKPDHRGLFRVNSAAGELDPIVNNTESNPVKKSIVKKRNLPFESEEKKSKSYG